MTTDSAEKRRRLHPVPERPEPREGSEGFWSPGTDYVKRFTKCQAPSRMPCLGCPRQPLDASRTAETDRHALLIIHDDRNDASTLAVDEHSLEIGRALLDVNVLERDLPPGTVFTGGFRVGSRVLAEDVHHSLHSTTAEALRRPSSPPPDAPGRPRSGRRSTSLRRWPGGQHVRR